MKKVVVWDLPVRVFHILLASLLVAAVVTAKLGGNALEWHMKIGYALLGLLLFRVLWGFLGGSHARFSSFLRGPKAILSYLKNGEPWPVGHNPLGALAVVAILLVLGLQVLSGLFANDDVMIEGPFVALISKDLSDTITSWHLKGQYAIYFLIGLHLGAVFYHRLYKGEDILRPMITGRKWLPEGLAEVAASRGGGVVRAAALLGVSLLAVWAAIAGVK